MQEWIFAPIDHPDLTFHWDRKRKVTVRQAGEQINWFLVEGEEFPQATITEVQEAIDQYLATLQA